MKKRIVEKGVKEIYICLDQDARKQALETANYFMSNGIEVYFVDLTEKDPNELGFEKTKDILADMGKAKKDQFLVGFALETNNEIENAKSKLVQKNLDLVGLNSIKDAGAGFETNTNKVTILSKDNKMHRFELKSKHDVANDIANLILNEIDA